MLFLKKEYRELVKKINQVDNNTELKKVLNELNTKDYSEEKINELKEVLYKKYSAINSDTFPYIIEYFYSKDTKLEFSVAIYLLNKLFFKIEFLTNLENIPLSEERFLELLPTICKTVMGTTSGIADCMYMVLLEHTRYYDKIDENSKNVIKNSLYKIGMALDYFERNKIVPTKEMLVNLEIMVDVAKLYNDPKVLKFVERTLDIDNIEINLFAVNTLIYNNIPVIDSYVEELARDTRTCKRFYKMLRNMDKLYRFPDEYLTQEHLAMGDMVHWLMHPAEIGDVPDKIEFVQTFEKNEEIFYVFKFQSQKDKFKDKGWMIGISGGYQKDSEPTIDSSGFTFSDFDQFDPKNIISLSEKIIDKINEAWKKRAEEMKNNS
ncbi:MAG: hypothetical protein Q4D02_08200 [Clostridia bacterium]|nr:hypothetical protein [Clostridia bacterium]